MMDTWAIDTAAALLDDIGSGKLEQSDFYYYVEQCGPAACALVLPLVNKTEDQYTPADRVIIAAAECLKDICTAVDPNKLMTALLTARMHMRNLHLLDIGKGKQG